MLLSFAIFISGRGSNLKAILESHDAGILPKLPSLIVTDRSSAAGLCYAEQRGIETCFINPKEFKGKKAFGAEVVQQLNSRGIDVAVLAGFMRIIDANLVEAFPNRIVNIHPSLLPSFAGLDAQQQAVDAGVKISGCTVHFVDEGVDTGRIIAQTAVPVLDGDSAETLSARILIEEHKLYPKVIAALIAGELA